jgi:hypothetical protein
MRKEIQINPNGAQIMSNVKIQGIVVAGYYLQLFEANSNNVIANYSGNNEYDDDDARTLPNTASKNVGRVLMLDTTIAAIDKQVDDMTYTVSLEIYQDGNLVDTAQVTDQLTNNVQDSLILVKLV